MKLNWKLVLNDLGTMIGIAWVWWNWNAKDDFFKFGAIVAMVCVMIWRIDAHITHYRQQRRIY
ncbi:MAG: hypothetical protein K0Q66_1134 [Chitinophagaceae bacterium]|nr:hypothetical protein [Chitinophagaceae bacterium]